MPRNLSVLRFVGYACAVSCLAFFPLWLLLYFFWPSSADLVFYANALDMFSQQFWSGDMYPRWLTAADHGAGAPVFVFYSPLVFYAASALQFLAPLDPHGLVRLMLTVQFFQITSASAAYLWLAPKMEREKALVAALAYGVFPQAIVMFYVNYAPTVAACLTWLALAFYAIDLRNTKQLRADAIFIAAVALLILSSLIYSVILLPLILAYGLFRQPKIMPALRLGVSSLSGVGIAAFYWLPALLNKKHIDINHAFTSGQLDFSSQFFSPALSLGALFILGPLLAAICIAYKAKRLVWEREILFWAAMLGVSWFMSTILSEPLWQFFVPLKYIQFPYRFLIISIPAAIYISTRYLSAPQLRAVFLYFLGMAVVCGISSALPSFLAGDLALEAFANHSITTISANVVGKEYATDLPAGYFEGAQLAYLISGLAVLWTGAWLTFLTYGHKKKI